MFQQNREAIEILQRNGTFSSVPHPSAADDGRDAYQKRIDAANNRDKNGFLLTIITALFVYSVVIYNVFIG